MPFMMREALKAEGLISCPGGTNCSSVWYNEHRTLFRHFFFFTFTRDWTCRSSQQNKLCIARHMVFSQIPCFVLQSPKVKAVTYFMFSLFFSIRRPRESARQSAEHNILCMFFYLL